MVESTGLENQRACKRSVGSNPTLSAIGFSQSEMPTPSRNWQKRQSFRRNDESFQLPNLQSFCPPNIVGANLFLETAAVTKITINMVFSLPVHSHTSANTDTGVEVFDICVEHANAAIGHKASD